MSKVPIVSQLDYNSGRPSDIGSFVELYSSQPSNGGVFAQNQVTIIPIGSVGKNCVLDPVSSRLEFSVRSDAYAWKPCGSAAAFIKSIQVMYGSAILENLNNYDAIHTALLDCTVDKNARHHQYNMLMGCSASTATADMLDGASVAVSTTRTYSISLLSGILGSLCKSYLPIYLLNGNLQLRIQWNDDATSVIPPATGNVVALKFSEIKYVCNLIMLNDRIIDTITDSEETVLYSESYVNSQYVYQAGATSINQLLTSPFSSLKTVFVIFRQSDAITSDVKWSNARSNCAIAEYSFMYGSKQVPSSRINCTSTNYIQAYDALRDALHCSGGSVGCMGILNYSNYTKADDTGAAAPTGAFLIGQNFESYQGRSSDIVSGSETQRTSLSFRSTISAAAGLAATTQMDVYSHFDMRLHFTKTGDLYVTF